MEINNINLSHKHSQVLDREKEIQKAKTEADKYSLNRKNSGISLNEENPRRNKPNPYKPQAIKHDAIVFISFFIFLVVFGLLFLVWKKQDISEMEKRTLQQKPKLTSERLFSGEYGKEFEAYYADQFPMRNQFMELYKSLVNLMNSFPGGKQRIHLVTGSKNQLNDTFEVNDPQVKNRNAQNQTDSDPKSITEPEIAQKENHNEDGHNLEKIVEEKNQEKAQNRELQYNDASNIIVDGKAMEIFGYFPENAVAYANRINYLREVLPDQIRLIHLVAPPAIAFNGLEELEAESEIVYQAIDQIYQAENDSIIKVDAISNIAKHADEYIYFNTDHHWTGRGAYYAYQAFCFYTGQTATALEDMELTKPDYNFLGSLYSFTGNSPLLENSKDQAEIFLPKYSGTNTVYRDTSMSDGVPTMLLDSESKIDSHYILYSGDDVALGLIKSDINNGKSILVIKDSFANAFLPFLMDNYENIYSIDPRYMTDPILPFINEKKINDVLVLNSAFITGNADWLGGFDNIIGY
ncbi:MAG: hypothetical protein GX328_01095 [Clostridiaceae bacterium]|nr:hypothetical protein [Clostridiaceae bacterium]